MDWNAIKTEYITTDTSYRKLAAKYGVTSVQVANVGKKEAWVEQRNRYLAEVLAKTLEKSSEAESDRLTRLMETTGKAIDVVVSAFDDEKQFHRYVVENEEKIFAKVDTKALKELTSVLKDLTGLMRDFYNIPTPAQAEAQRIAAARLELEQRKAAFDDDEDDDTGVIILPPVLEDDESNE